MKKLINFLKISFIIIILLSLVSCNLQKSVLYILGFDTKDYSKEEVITEYDPESEKAIELADMTRILSVDSPQLITFDNASEIVDECRDSILNYLLGKSYAKYAGNIELLNKVKKEYPEYQIATIIPADDYENIVYQYFGGNSKVINKSSKLFLYFSKMDVYTSITLPQKSKVEIKVISCKETENTYRLDFINSLDENNSKEYNALLIKREDGTCFFKSLTQIG